MNENAIVNAATDDDDDDDDDDDGRSRNTTPDLIMCRKMPGISIGRLCEKCACERGDARGEGAPRRGGGRG